MHVGRGAQPASETVDSVDGWSMEVVLRAWQKKVLEGQRLALSRGP